ncbi:hypothetical protein LCGC14_1007330 [marine sediment metagenome]|uniref:YqaJ viral recombinase domain-containing protein n=1 Tax=marine sediment metagenome TaxID=412755 RepID=A0A0F9QJM5_9ZZZZ
MNFHDVEQNSDEWYELRAGRFTSSNMPKVMAVFGKAFSVPAKQYAVRIAVEQLTKKPLVNNYYNEHMERGHLQEPIARRLYEEQTFCDVSNGGFFCSDFIGCSPDGLVYEEGVIEIKSVLAHIHFANIKRGTIDPAYRWQCIGNLKFTGRKWLDFVSYCADFPPEKQLYRSRIYAVHAWQAFEMIDERLALFEKLVVKFKKTIKDSLYFT